MKSLRLTLLTAALLFILTQVVLAQSDVTLLPDSPYSTEIVIKQSSIPGPAVMVLGGVHGNEPAGSLAAKTISQLTVVKGTLIVIPRVNKLALQNSVRTLDHIGDVNRAYPGRPDGTPAEQIAFAIDELLLKYKVTMLIDLHEGRAFHRLDKSSVGQTILFAANERSALLAMDAADHINRRISERNKQFSLVAHPVPKSGAHHAAERYGIAAFTLETAGTQQLAKRVNQHISLVTYLLQREGLL